MSRIDDPIAPMRALMQVATPSGALKIMWRILNEENPGSLDLADVAHTLMEVTRAYFCPLCQGSRFYEGRSCPSCHADQGRYIDVDFRIKRYRILIPIAQRALKQTLQG